MNFHFKINKERGFYRFNSEGFLEKKFKKNVEEQIKVRGEELHHEFLKILLPIYDYYKDNNLEFTHTKETAKDVVAYMEDNQMLVEEVEYAIIQFANKFGIGTNNSFMDFNEMLYGEYSPVVVEGDLQIDINQFTASNLVQTALRMAQLLISRESYQTVPTEMRDLCNRVGSRLVPQINGGIYYETKDIFASMFWSMAFTEFQYEIKQCRWCKAPLLTDVRATFCKRPRQCKNKFHNPNRSKKKKKENK